MKYARKKDTVKKQVRFKKKHLLWIYFAAFISIQVFFTIHTATAGAELANLEEKAGELSEEKRILEDTLVSKSSLKSLEEKAQKLRLSKNENVVYFQPEQTFAKAD